MILFIYLFVVSGRATDRTVDNFFMLRKYSFLFVAGSDVVVRFVFMFIESGVDEVVKTRRVIEN